MDALLADLQVVCSQLLPVLGAVALIFLCIFLKKLAALMDTVNHTVQSLDPTLQKVNQSIDKVQAPLDTAVKYSHTLVHLLQSWIKGLNGMIHRIHKRSKFFQKDA